MCSTFLGCITTPKYMASIGALYSITSPIQQWARFIHDRTGTIRLSTGDCVGVEAQGQCECLHIRWHRHYRLDAYVCATNGLPSLIRRQLNHEVHRGHQVYNYYEHTKKDHGPLITHWSVVQLDCASFSTSFSGEMSTRATVSGTTCLGRRAGDTERLSACAVHVHDTCNVSSQICGLSSSGSCTYQPSLNP